MNALSGPRPALFPALQLHLDRLLASGAEIALRHEAARGQLIDWLVHNYRPGVELPVVAVCTGNSRRSVMMSTLLNVAAAYCGLPEIRGYSGGTQPSAVDRRTLATLAEAGLQTAPIPHETAADAASANPRYLIRWAAPSQENPTEICEFSKSYDDPVNPRQGFAALMVCHEADAGCPVVHGADVRISLPLVDPKGRDNQPDEAQAYANCRDEIGRLVLSTLLEVRRRLEQAA